MSNPIETIKELGDLCKEKLPKGWHYLIVASPNPLTGGRFISEHGRSSRDEAVGLATTFVSRTDGGWSSPDEQS